MEISELKQKLSITDVAQALDIKMNGYNKALCPFHDDKIPSLQFSKEKGICTCFSSNCNAGTMDIIGLTEKKLKVTTHEALKWLANMAGNGQYTNPQKKLPTKDTPETLSRIAVLKKVFTYYENAFMGSSPARKYTEKRGLDHRRLTIGYNNGTMHHGENKHLISSLENIGLLKQAVTGGAGYNIFGNGCLVFPLKNKQNQITGLYFRALEPQPKKMQHLKQEPHLYLKDRQGLYPGYPDPETTKLIITESIIDTATLIENGKLIIDNEKAEVLTAYGTNGLTAEHKEAIQELKELEEIIIFFDGDEPGREGSKARAKELSKIVNCKLSIVNCPEGEDINSLSVSHTPELFTELLQNRKSFSFSSENTSLEKEKTQQSPQSPQSHQSLNTLNPYKISYTTQTAIYYIKGGLPKALDSLKDQDHIGIRGQRPISWNTGTATYLIQ